MKILIFPEQNEFGGITTFCVKIAAEFSKRKIDYRLVVVQKNTLETNNIIEECQKQNLSYITFKSFKKIDFHLIYNIIKYIKTHDVKILHTNGYRFNNIVRVIRFILFFTKYKIKHVVFLHGLYAFKTAPLKSRLIYRFDYLLSFLNTHTVAVSEKTKKQFLRYSLLTNHKIKVIYNGIITDNSTTVKRNKKGKKIITFIGRLSKEKGVYFLTDIISKIEERSHNYVFHVYGDGPLKDYIVEKSKEYKDLLIYKGFTNNPLEAISNSDLIILTSQTEGLPMVILEAMACKVPVIATKVGGVPEIITNYQNGVLIDYGNTVEFIKQTTSLLNNKELYEKIANNALLLIDDKFSIENTVNKILNLYDNKK